MASRETAKAGDIHRVLRSREAEVVLSALARRQHGVVGRVQLEELGFGEDAIRHRQRLGRIHQLYRGAFAVGHRDVSREGRWLGAVLASGQDVALSHWSAAAFWMVRANSRLLFDVTTPHKSSSWDGIKLHHKALPSDEVTVHE